MIPVVDPAFDVENELEEEKEPTLTYLVRLDNADIFGKTDETEAMKQAIYKIISTERYQHEIYSWDYGIELNDLFGKPKSYIRSEIVRRFEEALLQDDRVTALKDISVTFEKRGTVSIFFTAETTVGTLPVERVVRI